MDDTDDPPIFPILSHATVDRFVNFDGPPRPAPSGPWVLNRDVLKAWYNAANQYRPSPHHGSLFRRLSEAAPHLQDPIVPALLEYSTLQFEDYAKCHICTHLGPHGNATGPGASFTMYLFIENRLGRWRPNDPYWVSTVDSSFTAYVATHIHHGHIMPAGLNIALAMLGPECANMDVHPNKPAICPPKMMWAKVRWAVAVRPWVIAWIEDHAKRNGGPGGKFFKQELEAFAEGFCS